MPAHMQAAWCTFSIAATAHRCCNLIMRLNVNGFLFSQLPPTAVMSACLQLQKWNASCTAIFVQFAPLKCHTCNVRTASLDVGHHALATDLVVTQQALEHTHIPEASHGQGRSRLLHLFNAWAEGGQAGIGPQALDR